MIHVKCSLCENDNFFYHSVMAKKGYPGIIKVQCKECGLVYTNPRMTDEELDAFYQNYYSKLAMAEENFKEKVLLAKEMNKDYLIDQEFYKENILKYKDGGRYLEIGGGLGFQAWVASRLGFEVFVTEYDKEAAEFAREHFGLVNYQLGDLHKIKYESSSFDFISCWHCIEHVQDLDIFLKEVFRILKPGGVFYFTTPNLGSSLYRGYRVYKLLTLSIPKIIDGIEHTYGLSPNTAEKLCEKYGFEKIKIYSFGRSKRKAAPPDLGVSSFFSDFRNLLLCRPRFTRALNKLANHFLGTKVSAHLRKPMSSS